MTKAANIAQPFTRILPKETRTIETTLYNKDEVFRMLALAETIERPILLKGLPGVSKTKCVLEYAKARTLRNVDRSNPDEVINARRNFMDKVFILETDEGTKPNEVKGRMDMEKFVMENKYQLDAPIADAEVIIINEVDKGQNIRNSLLGVMNEKLLLSGKEKKPCVWKLFVATCNAIPREELGNPFWDRFLIFDVNRITKGEMIEYFKKGGRSYRAQLSVSIPTKDEMDAIDVPIDKLIKFTDLAYDYGSDRTLLFIQTITRAIALIWNVSVNKALVKACSIMINKDISSRLNEKLISPTLQQILSKVEMLNTAKTQAQITKIVQEIGDLIQKHASTGNLNQDDIEDITQDIEQILATKKQPADELLQNALA